MGLPNSLSGGGFGDPAGVEEAYPIGELLGEAYLVGDFCWAARAHGRQFSMVTPNPCAAALRQASSAIAVSWTPVPVRSQIVI
jgi:hypothetical protein